MRGRNIEMFAMTENVLLLILDFFLFSKCGAITDSLVEFRDAPA